MTTTQTTAKAKSYGKPTIGCYLDQSYRNSVDHDIATIQTAIGFGFVPDRAMAQLMARIENECTRKDEAEDWSQILSESADEAIDWLNSQEIRSFLYWANDGERNAFGLWANVEGAREDVGFVSRKDVDETTDPEDASYPAADYDGEWLHVSDHGNATLYFREQLGARPDGKCDFRDVEVWSVV